VRFNGTVTGKSTNGDEDVVDVAIDGLRQDGEASIKATAQVALPHRP
jgi:hypothetical protein